MVNAQPGKKPRKEKGAKHDERRTDRDPIALERPIEENDFNAQPS